ncbi:MAG: acyl-CoA dehydrogenase family protein [Desulfuromonadales bacterium]|nr:acyl-CoA dehydrogenase family protein [Desulfuromonadales bacterium]
MSRSPSAERSSLEVAEAARETLWQRPSIVGQMFMGRLPSELLFPFPEQEPADRAAGDAILAKVANFLADHVDADRIDASHEIPPEVIDGLRTLGLFGIKISTEYGGLGLSQINYNRIMQLVASHCASTAVLLSAHQSIGVPQPLKLCGTPEQKAKYLPRLAAGAISAFALTEPGAGSDPSQMATTAVLTEDESAWLINGEKLWISNGPIAELLIVMARTNAPQAERPEITAFIVETDSPGFSVLHRCDFMGLKGLQNGLLRFDNVRVPAENLVDGRGRGLSLALRTLNTGRLTLPAACGGAMKQALAMATTWARERQQWGAPIGEHEAVAAKLAGIAADLYAVESLTWLTSALADRGEIDIRLEAAMAKLFCTEALWRSADAALQVRGGRGYETALSLAGRGEPAMPMERLLRDARINLIIEGTSEIMRLFIAREALDPHLRIAGASATSERVDYLGAAKFYALWYPKLYWPNFKLDGEVQLPEMLRPHLHDLARDTRRLARDLFHMIARHRQGLQRRQLVLGRLVDCGAELFAIGAVLARAASPSAPAESLALADLFCRQARRRVESLRQDIYHNDDAENYRFARALLDGRFAWLTDNIVSTWRREKPRE